MRKLLLILFLAIQTNLCLAQKFQHISVEERNKRKTIQENRIQKEVIYKYKVKNTKTDTIYRGKEITLYDSLGKTISIHYLNEKNEQVADDTFQYDSLGRMICVIYSNSFIRNQSVTRKITYKNSIIIDQRFIGDKITLKKIKNIDHNGNTLNYNFYKNSALVSESKLKYDNRNREISHITKGMNGKLLVKTTKKYKSDKLVEVKIYTAKTQKETKYMYKYSPQHLLTKIHKYSNDKLIAIFIAHFEKYPD